MSSDGVPRQASSFGYPQAAGVPFNNIFFTVTTTNSISTCSHSLLYAPIYNAVSMNYMML